MSLAPLHSNPSRSQLATQYYQGKVKKRVIDWFRLSGIYSVMRRKRRNIAERFRTNVLLRTGLRAFQDWYRKNSACYQVAWQLNKQVKYRLVEALVALQTCSRSPEPVDTSISAILNYRRTETPLSGGLSESLRPLHTRSDLETKGKSLKTLLGTLLFRRVFPDSSHSDLNLPIQESLMRTLKSKTAAATSPVSTRAFEALRKSERLSQKVSSIIQMLSSGKSGESDTFRSIQSRESTPKRSLNLRIPTSHSSASSPPLSPISMSDLESDTSRLRHLRRVTSDLPSSRSVTDLEIGHLDDYERLLQVWKAWKDFILQRKLKTLKYRIGEKSAKLRNLRKVWNGMRVWKGKGREKRDKKLLAQYFYCNHLKKKTFRRLHSILLLLIQKSYVNRLYPTRILLRIIHFWHQFASFQSKNTQKLTTFLRFSTKRKQRKYIKLWKIVSQVVKIRKQQQENALFHWFEHALPRYWNQFAKGVEILKAKREISIEADRNYAFLLVKKSISGWRNVNDFRKKLRNAYEKVFIYRLNLKGKRTLNRLKEFANNHRKSTVQAIAVSHLYKSITKTRIFRHMREFAFHQQVKREKVDRALLVYAKSLMNKAILGWEKRAKRIKLSKEAETIITENHYFNTACDTFLQWKNFVSLRKKACYRLEIKQQKSLISLVFQEFKQICAKRIARREKEIGKIMKHQNFITKRVFSLWLKSVKLQKTHKIANQKAKIHCLNLIWKQYRRNWRQTTKIRLIIQKKSRKIGFLHWKKIVNSFHLKEYRQILAKKYYKVKRIKAFCEVLKAEIVGNKRYFEGVNLLISKRNEWKLRQIWNSWKNIRLMLRRGKYAGKLAEKALEIRRQKSISQILLFLYNYTKKSGFLRKKSKKFRQKSVFLYFESKINFLRNRKLENRRLQRIGKKHEIQSRLQRGFDSLYNKIAVKKRLISTCGLILKQRISAFLSRWKGYQKRYLGLMWKADLYRGKKELDRKKETIKWLWKSAKKNSWGRRMEKRMFFYWDQRVKRVFLAWKRRVIWRVESEELVLKMQVTVLMKAYLVTLRKYAVLQRKLKSFKTTHTSDRKTALLRTAFAAIRQHFHAEVSLRTGHFRALTLHTNFLYSQVFHSWVGYAKTHRTKRIQLQRNFHLWNEKKALQCAMNYVQPRVRKVTGMKLTALFKWKMAVSQPISDCPPPLAHVFMKFLVPKYQEFPAIPHKSILQNAVPAMLFSQWRAAELYNRLFLNVRGAIFRRRLLGKFTLIRFKRGALVARVHRKKLWNAVLFSRFNGKLRVFFEWKSLTLRSRRPKSTTRVRTAAPRPKSAIRV